MTKGGGGGGNTNADIGLQRGWGLANTEMTEKVLRNIDFLSNSSEYVNIFVK